MHNGQGATHRSMWSITARVRCRILCCGRSRRGRARHSIGGVGRCNRMTPYTYRRLPGRVAPANAMTIDVIDVIDVKVK